MENESIHVDILLVGGGVASLSCAIRLAALAEAQGKKVGDDFTIAVLEKGSVPGLHNLSGAIMDPGPLSKLIPDYEALGAPVGQKVLQEDMIFLTPKRRFCLPFIPKDMDNRGHYLVSLSRLTAWMAQLAEELGVEIFSGYAGSKILYDGNGVAGIRTGDQGRDKQGDPKPGFLPGIDILARATVFGEGSHGSLTRDLMKTCNLDMEASPQSYVLGLKEIWETREGALPKGYAAHLMGYPLKNEVYGGGFLYAMPENRMALGLMIGLDYSDPNLDPYQLFQQFKTHPFIREKLDQGKMIQYGAKTVPVAGYYAVPKLVADRAMIIGDGGGLFLNRQIKGIHVAITSGMLAADTLAEALTANDFSALLLSRYQEAFNSSPVGKQIRQNRSFHQLFQGGRRSGMVKAALQGMSRGLLFASRPGIWPDFSHLKPLESGSRPPRKPDPTGFGDTEIHGNKANDLYYSGTRHEEDQVCHIRIKDSDLCGTRCLAEFNQPCLRFCPAGVYEAETNKDTRAGTIRINFTNCLHCKTCEIKDPYRNIVWQPPEGGGGPKYLNM